MLEWLLICARSRKVHYTPKEEVIVQLNDSIFIITRKMSWFNSETTFDKCSFSQQTKTKLFVFTI